MAATATNPPPGSRSARRDSFRAPPAWRRPSLTPTLAGQGPRQEMPMAELFSFSPGRRALVTGGASGLGLGAARRLLEIGARVAIADLPKALERLAPEDVTRFLPIAMDVSDDSAVAAGVAAAAKDLGGLDTLVNSAGV